MCFRRGARACPVAHALALRVAAHALISARLSSETSCVRAALLSDCGELLWLELAAPAREPWRSVRTRRIPSHTLKRAPNCLRGTVLAERCEEPRHSLLDPTDACWNAREVEIAASPVAISGRVCAALRRCGAEHTHPLVIVLASECQERVELALVAAPRCRRSRRASRTCCGSAARVSARASRSRWRRRSASSTALGGRPEPPGCVQQRARPERVARRSHLAPRPRAALLRGARAQPRRGARAARADPMRRAERRCCRR